MSTPETTPSTPASGVGAPAAIAPEALGRPLIRVAHILDGRHFGGGEQMVRRLLQGSPRAGIEAWAYCLSKGRLADFMRAEGLRVRLFEARGRFDWRVLPRLIQAARQDGIQVLQAHTSRTHLAARLVSARLGIPNITTIQSPIALDENKSVGAHPLRAWVERLGRPWTQHIAPVSREETERLIREEGVPPRKITWIPNGVNDVAAGGHAPARRALETWLASEGLPTDAFVIAMIAQMRPRKGPEVLLQAFARWIHDGGHGVLLMIGDDEFTQGSGYLETLRALANGAGIASQVRFTGFMKEPWSLAAGADLIALPSRFGEGLPLVLLEAMSHALPIAVSDTAGNRELADGGRCGWVHTPGDHATLARQLAEAAAAPQSTRGRGEAGRRDFLAHYTLERVVDQHRQLYEKLISQHLAPQKNR